jgi:hypothetical protein
MIDLIPGESVIYKRGQEFDCPEERAKKLGNSVIILDKPLVIENPPRRKRR